MPKQALMIDQEHIDRMNETYFTFVDRIITLSTGALALSVAFRSSFSKAVPIATWLLQTSWVGFVVAILAGLVLLANRAMIHKLTAKKIWELLKQKPDEWPREGWVLQPPRMFVVAKWIMPTGFAIGIVALAVFAILNVP